MKRYLFLLVAIYLMAAAGCSVQGRWTAGERALIEGQSDVMRVLTVEQEEDLAVLRMHCKDLSVAALRDPLYAELSERLVATVTSPEQNGVGIAGPQVGISRRVVAVQRFDKEGEPFEVIEPFAKESARMLGIEAGEDYELFLRGVDGMASLVKDNPDAI